MKPLLSLLVALSLGANIFLWSRFRATQPAADSSNLSFTASSASHLANETSSQSTTPTQPPGKARAPKWNELPIGDLNALVGRLRALKFPEAAIHAIVETELKREYHPRLAALEAQRPQAHYWRRDTNPPTAKDAETRTQIRALLRERSARLQSLLGDSVEVMDPLDAAYLRIRYGHLPSTKVEAVEAVESDYTELQRQIWETGDGLLLPEDRELLDLLAREKQKDLKALLTPEEYENFELHHSPTAWGMRMNLAGMDLNEETFRTIFRLQRPFDELHNVPGRSTSPEMAAAKAAAQRELIASVKAALGEELGAQYELSRDPRYGYYQIAARDFALSKESAVRLWSLEKETRARYQQIGADQSVASPERFARQKVLLDAALASIEAEVGADKAEAFRARSAGWLRGLQQTVDRNLGTAPPLPASP